MCHKMLYSLLVGIVGTLTKGGPLPGLSEDCMTYIKYEQSPALLLLLFLPLSLIGSWGTRVGFE